MEMFFVGIAEKGLVPDAVVRTGIRRYLKQRIEMSKMDGNVETQQSFLDKFIEDVKTREIAEQTGAANAQHYEVPSELYLMMLGKHLKYSCCLYEKDSTTLDEAEKAMLEVVCERAELDSLSDGSVVLDLGCGWGSCGLYIAEKYPKLQVKCVSNSESQQVFIKEKAKERGLKNIVAATCDINTMTYPRNSIDRVVSNEMFEHMKNYEKLLEKISSWLKDDGKLFVHIFTHKAFTYHFDKGWMAETFFTGGTMPGRDLLLRFNKHMGVDKQWSVNGTHYSRTLEHWLDKIDDNKTEFRKLCSNIYGEKEADKWVFNWRLFHIACSELFKYDGGNEWFVSHYLFSKRHLS